MVASASTVCVQNMIVGPWTSHQTAQLMIVFAILQTINPQRQYDQICRIVILSASLRFNRAAQTHSLIQVGETLNRQLKLQTSIFVLVHIYSYSYR